MAEEHRRDLTLLGPVRHQLTPPRSAAEVHVLAPGKPSASHLIAPQHGDPVLRLRSSADRRPVGHQVGTLLIRLGTRLGGASMRTS
jgi:hypothetical protein